MLAALSSPRSRARSTSDVAALLALAGLQACTSIPQAQFDAYREAYAAARESIEDVYTDFAAVTAIKTELEAPAAAPPQTTTYSSADVRASWTSQHDKDPIAVRLDALQTIDRYNDSLARLASGESVKEVGAAVDNFAASLSKLPFQDFLGKDLTKEVINIGGTAIPLGQVATQILEMAERERTRRQFLETVKAGAPIVERLLNLLIADTDDMYGAQKALLFDKKRNALIQHWGRLYTNAQSLLKMHTFGPDTDALVGAADSAIAKTTSLNGALGNTAKITTPTAATPEETADANVRVQAVTDTVKDIHTLDAQLAAYRQILAQTTNALLEVGELNRSLLAAANASRTELPDMQGITEVVRAIKSAQAEYQKNGG